MAKRRLLCSTHFQEQTSSAILDRDLRWVIGRYPKVEESLKRIGRFEEIELGEIMESRPFGYRNKVIYPLGRSSTGNVVAGYYQKGTHRIVNVNQCPVQDSALDLVLARVKADLDPWEIYDEATKKGDLKSLVMRVGQRTGEVLITLVSTKSHLSGLREWSAKWMDDFPSVVGICLNHHPDHSNRIFGPATICLHGRDYIKEIFCGLELQIRSTAFFQVNTEQAERMVLRLLSLLELNGRETIVDGYAGIGTMILPIAKTYPLTQCWAIDSHSPSIECARFNAERNQICNVRFKVKRKQFITY